MKNFTDLNLANEQLADKVRSLGFTNVTTLKVAKLPSKTSCDVIEGNVDLLVSACKQNKEFNLINPLLDGDFYKSDALVEIARDKKKAFEIPFYSILHSRNRAKLFFQLRIFLKKCLKRRVPFFFSSRAETEFDLKSPREIIAIANVLGLTYEQAAAAISLSKEELQ